MGSLKGLSRLETVFLLSWFGLPGTALVFVSNVTVLVLCLTEAFITTQIVPMQFGKLFKYDLIM